MPPVLTSLATVMCPHGGRVTLIPRQTTVLIQGGSVLCEPDLVGAPIVGCTQPATPTTKPCTVVLATLPGSTSPKVMAVGRPVYVATLTATTDGVPPAVVTVINAGQAAVQA
ncbi:MAG TPA: hypothetical protein VD931_14790 [Baekduia sp.]|nr:hypothetical protein [Baekduia sp.]